MKNSSTLFIKILVTISFLLSLSMTAQAQKKVNYVKKSSISLTKGQAKTLRKNPMFKVSGLKAVPATGFSMYTHKNQHFLVLNKELKKVYNKIPSGISTYFQDIGSGEASDGSMLIWVCSCGDNKYDSEGDMCYMSIRPSGAPECVGGCHGGNEGKTCTVTMDLIPPEGVATVIQN